MTIISIEESATKASNQFGTISSFVNYTFFKLDPEWRRLKDSERQATKHDFLTGLDQNGKELSLRTYSLVGTRANADFMLWTIADSLDKFQVLQSQLLKTTLGKFVSTPYSYLAMFRPSDYFGKSREAAPVDAKYLFVYPLTKKREWYSLLLEV